MNQYRLRIEFDKFQRDRERQRFDDSWPWIATLLAFLLALIPSDFQDSLGLSADTWTAIGVILAGGSAFMILRIWYQAFRQRNNKAPTAEEAVERLISEMGNAAQFTQSSSDRGVRLS